MPVQTTKTISFLASHGGSSARQIIAAINKGDIPANTGIIITNNRDSKIYQWCQQQAFPITHISSNTHQNPDQEDLAILHALTEAETDLVVLSGYMKKIKNRTLEYFSNRILNIHPSLLPKHGGAGKYGDKVHTAVLEAGDKLSGASVHLINEIYDDGPVLAQREVSVYDNDTVATLRARVQGIEAELYIDAIKQFLKQTSI